MEQAELKLTTSVSSYMTFSKTIWCSVIVVNIIPNVVEGCCCYFQGTTTVVEVLAIVARGAGVVSHLTEQSSQCSMA